MADVHQQLVHIQSLIYSLVEKYEEALHDNESLTQRIHALNEELTERNRRLELQEGELKTAKIARGLSSNNEDSDLAKAKISSLVREIDRCIALLNE